ncbi:MAG TPA: DNA polymerase III subunit delta [Coriobacteriia bacterium]|nr:DNA polymerase III subunit delta [Coriobacteriia bacterium]
MAEKPLSAMYLFNGDDNLKQEMLLERLRKRVESGDETGMNVQVINEKELQGPAHLTDILNTIPFGSPQRLVIVKEVDTLKKPLVEALTAYVAAPLETTVLAMTAKKLARNTRFYKAIEKYSSQSIIDCSQKKRSELPQLIRGIAQAEGVEIGVPAANALIDRVGTSTVSLSTETKKLAAIIKGKGAKTITENDVRSLVALAVEPKSWDLTNALAQRDLSLCLQLLARMKGFTEVGLFAICVTRIREILTAQTLKNRREPVAAGMGKQDWQIREIVRGAELYRQSELLALLKEAPVIEKKMKSGSDAKQLLELWIVAACAGSSIRA